MIALFLFVAAAFNMNTSGWYFILDPGSNVVAVFANDSKDVVFVRSGL